MNTNLKLEILEKLTSLITASFGLVAALAWNEAIKEIINVILPKPSMLLGKIIYAVIITILVVFITVKLSGAINRIKEVLEKNKKNE